MPLPNARMNADKSFHNTIRYEDPSRHWIGIVGGGAAGAQFFKESIRRAIGSGFHDLIGYFIFDNRPYEEIGQGLAWNLSQSDLMLANMRVNTLGLPPDLLGQLSPLLPLEKPEDLSDRVLFQRRKDIGKILHIDFDRHVVDGRAKDIPIIHIRSGCVAIYQMGSGYLIEAQAGDRIFCHDIILGLGHKPSHEYAELRGTPNYFHNPWDWSFYKNIPKKSRVGLLGLGPTAVDAALMLNEQGVSSVASYSRTGQIQYPRPRSEPHDPKFMKEEYIRDIYDQTKLSFSQVITLINTEYTWANVPCAELSASLRKVDSSNARDVLLEGLKHTDKDASLSKWFAVLKSFDDVTPYIWHLLPDEERQLYWRKYRKNHTTLSYGMASIQAARLTTLMVDRQFITKSGVSTVAPNTDGTFSVSYIENGTVKTDVVDVLVNCCGIGADITKDESQLIQFLIANESLTPHPWGGALVDFESGQILTKDGTPLGQIYALVGSLTYGTHLLTHCLGQVAKSATRTARAVHKKISDRNPLRI